MSTPKFDLEEVLNLLPTTTSLYYVEYRDDLENHLQELQDCIHANNWEAIEDQVCDWYNEQVSGNELDYKKQLRKDFQSKYDISKEHAKDIVDYYEDHIYDEIHSRCNDTPVKDLLRNTCKESIYFDTCYYMEADSWNWDARRVKREVNEIKKVLKIKASDKRHNDALAMMIQQASYGGQLVLYFRPSWNELISEGEQDFETISFKNPTIAITNTSNGSGDSCHLSDIEITLPFVRENLFIDKLDKYSYVYQVCGMCSDWCDGTDATLSIKKRRGRKAKAGTSDTYDIRQRDAELDKVFKSGSCTPGDRDSSRHRNTFYRNDYPCGTKCSDCGTFWID
jgi:hypothetical protein